MNKVVRGWLNHIWLFWQYVFKQFFGHKASYQAAALTYASLLAMVPLFAVILKIVSLLPFYRIFTQKVEDFIYENFIIVKGGVIHSYLANFAQQASHLPFIGSVFLVIMVITVLVTLEKIFNAIWEVTPEPLTLKSLLSYWAGLLIPISIMLVALIIISASLSLPFMQYNIPFFSIQLLAFLPFLLAVFGFSALYYLVPNCKVKYRHALIAGLLTTTLLTSTKKLLAWYLTHFSVYQLIYGAFAIIPIILLWFYVVWLITLFGAEVCHALEAYNESTKR